MTISLTKLVHSSFLVESEASSGLIDPAWQMPIDCIYETDYKFKINWQDLKLKKIDFIFISHDHADHFDPHTLVQFSLDTLIVFPRVSPSLERNLHRLGFFCTRPLDAWEVITIGNLQIMCVPNEKNQFESAVAFKNNQSSVIVLADCHPSQMVAEKFIKFWGQPTLLITNPLPGLESQLTCPELCLSHNEAKYNDLVTKTISFMPNHIMVIGGELMNLSVKWINSYLYPISMTTYVDLYGQAGLSVVCESRAGQTWVVEDTQIRQIKKSAATFFTIEMWQDKPVEKQGVRSFADYQDFQILGEKKADYLDEFMLGVLKAASFFQGDANFWRCRIHDPVGIIFDFTLSLSEHGPTWRMPDGGEKLINDISYSGLEALIDGRISSHVMLCSDQLRVSVDGYEARKKNPVLLWASRMGQASSLRTLESALRGEKKLSAVSRTRDA